MNKNGFLRKCIIIMLPTVVFPLSVSFLKSVGIQYCAVISNDKNLFIMTNCGSRRSSNSKQRLLKGEEEAGYTSGSVSYSVNVCTLLPLSVVNWLSNE